MRRNVLKKLFSIFVLAIALLTFTLQRPSQAAEVSVGAKLFNANCASCHAGGVNRVIAAKSLQKDALEKYKMYSKEAIVNQVTNGKGAMPSFRGRLKPQQIEEVADYVLEESDKGWSKS